MMIFVRIRLRNLLNQAIKSTLVTVTAPTGYGKTQTVADFIINSGLESIWTKVVSLDSEPDRFWDSFTLAAMEKFPGLATRLRYLGFPRTNSDILEFIHILDEETAGSSPVIFVFDDFGRVAEGQVGRFMKHVLEIGPRNCRIILISSTKTGMDVAGLRSSGVFQITSEDLRFTELEAREYYLSVGVSVSRSSVHRIIKFTEGWPMALRLMGSKPDSTRRNPSADRWGVQSLQENPSVGIAGQATQVNTSADIAGQAAQVNPSADMAGSQSFLIESDALSKYMGLLTPEALSIKFEIIQSIFETDYFYCYNEEFRNALIKLSLLPSFILENLKNTGLLKRHQAVEFIMSNLFIVYNPETRRYTMHTMYREFLKGWQSTLSEIEKKQFRRDAGATFMEHSCFLEAIDCFGKCDRYSEMLTALEEYYRVKGTGIVEDYDYILSIMLQFPRSFRTRNPLIDYIRAVIYYVNNEPERCEAVLRALVDRLNDSGFHEKAIEEYQEMLGNAYYILGCLGISCSKEDFGIYFKKAVMYLQGAQTDEEELQKPLLLHGGNCNVIGMNGKEAGALARDERALPKPSLFYGGNCSIIGMNGKEAGALARMEKAIRENMPCYRLLSGGGDGLSLLFSAEAAFHTLDLDSAKAYARKAMQEASDYDQHDIFLNAAFVLARTALMGGDFPEMGRQMSIITDYVDNHDVALLRVFRDSVISWLYLNIGLPGMLPSGVVNPTILKKNSLLTLGCRFDLLHAYYLIVTEAYEQLMPHISKMEGKYSRWIDRLNIHILRAVTETKTGNFDEAMEALSKAYEMTRENGIVAPFVELGHPMYTLVEFIKKNNSLGFDPQWLDNISVKSASYAKKLSIVAKELRVGSRDSGLGGVRLTKREMEVLSDLSLGKTREEIAHSNFISINTVKSVIKNIYGKLGAVNRADAIRISANLGILDDRMPR
ncbi:hypothetical protein FACS1894127_1530 [Clostridia bacterium]|nr:hypothetical protein FACS1894127_1530 [Clostridia bacterium]